MTAGLTRRLASFGAALALLAVVAPASAQKISDRTLTIVVPATAGTGLDVLARLLAEGIREAWKQPIVVENKAGASSNIGTTAVARAEPDGHTVLLAVNTFVMNAGLFRTLPYDPEKSFAPIVKIASGGLALTVHPSLGVSSLRELVALAKAKPGVIDYASPGRGTPQHLAMELLKLRAGIDLKHIPYTGSAGAVRDLMAGHVKVMFVPVHTVLPLVADGQLRVLAISSAERSALAPDTPTLREAGVERSDVDLWYGLLAPAGTAPDLVARWNAVINEILAGPQARRILEAQGLVPDGGPPEILKSLITRDLERWRATISEAAITAE